MKIFLVIFTILFSFVSFNLFATENSDQIPKIIYQDFKQPTILGKNRFRYFGFHVYDIKTVIEEKEVLNLKDPSKIAICIDYNREISKEDLIEASLFEIENIIGSKKLETLKAKYTKIFDQIYSNVKDGDQKVAIRNDNTLKLYYNNKLVGNIKDELFARLFMGIWLDEKASHKKMRKNLLNIN